MRIRTSSARRGLALTLLSAALGAPQASGQESGSTGRSVYDRPARVPSSSRPPRAEPRRLPAAKPEAALERPLARPRRAKGYLSHGLSEARPSASAPRLPARRAAPAAISASPAARGVVPAFFPAPIGAAEPPQAVDPTVNASREIAAQLMSTAPGEHPLAPAVRWAKLCRQKMEAVKDYSAKLVKRERIDGALTDYEYLYVKVRHQPFSVYLSFIGPARVKGQEALFVQGRNDGKLMAHANGYRKIFGTVSLKPDSMLAMSGNRYPITELGVKRLTERLIEVGEHDSRFPECEVKAFPNTKINGRDCVCLQVLHPVRRKEFLFHMAKIYVDSQYNVPVRYESYDWPREPGGEPLLMEEYTYLELKFNNGFTDRDFDPANPAYQFR